MNEQKPSKMAEEARDCMERAVHDELVKKAKLGQDTIVNNEIGRMRSVYSVVKQQATVNQTSERFI